MAAATRARGAARHRAAGLALAAGVGLSPAAGPALSPAPAVHPGVRQPRPLHLRVAEADAAARVRVEHVEPGRIRVGLEETLAGELPPSFEVKRSPMRPPPLEAGDRALLLLRGARPPYVLVDTPGEIPKLGRPEDDANLLAVRELLARRGRPVDLARLYAGWLDRGPAILREIAFRGLLEPSLDTPPVRSALALGRARAAGRSDLPSRVRQLSALLAARTSQGAKALLASLSDPAADPGVTALALRAGAAHGLPETPAALRRALLHPDPALRRAALSSTRPLLEAFGEQLDPILAAARQDADPGVREAAERWLRGRPHPH